MRDSSYNTVDDVKKGEQELDIDFEKSGGDQQNFIDNCCPNSGKNNCARLTLLLCAIIYLLFCIPLLVKVYLNF